MINCFPPTENNLTLFLVAKTSNVRRLHLGFNNRVIGDAAHASTVRVDRARFRRCIDYSSARSFLSKAILAFHTFYGGYFLHSLHGENTKKQRPLHSSGKNLGGNDSSNLAKENQCDSRPFLRSASFHEKSLAIFCKQSSELLF